MTRKNKLIKKLLERPASLRYSEVEQILVNIGFEKVSIVGSHHKFKHSLLTSSLIVPVHNNECNEFYKKLAAKIIKENNLHI